MRRTVFRGVLSLVLLSLCAMPAAAAQKKPKIKTPESRSDAPAARPAVDTVCPADDHAGGAGFRAFVDRETGRLREPTPEEARAFSRAAREDFARAIESLQPFVLPDGTIAVDLKGLFAQDLVMTRNPDGSFSMRCVPDSERALALGMPLPPKPAPKPEQR